ncbi:uncharacterized protein LOC119674238 [Teleopsis dalmanni]|uniref:uncharacterized protein LOC119674238 n=1 Tax=Teleopsis dalmanni TaxID=139649 RepID=UPI0018CEB204|nr:uncharacterized protein LOC119674238 [Teleopsis dalmanni]
MCSTRFTLKSVIFISLLFVKVFSYVEFTNIVCKSLDKKTVEISYSYMKSINRSYKYISLRAKVHKLPITNLKINYALFKRANGYKPFLYNITVDACAFMKSHNNPVTTYIYNIIKEHTNLNRSCPLNHDIIVEKLDATFLEKKLMLLPFPSGQYAFNSIWIIDNISRVDFWLYFKIITDN